MALADLDVLEPLPLTRRHKVVLVDDDPGVLGSLRRLLRREPYDLLTTDRPEMALAWVEQGDVSLVVLDQRMPDLCGTELAERVRRCSPGTIRVMLTGYPGNAIVRHGLAQDVQWLISKPWNDDALRVTLRLLLRDRESPPPGSGGTGRSLPLRRSGALSRASKAAARGIGWAVGFFGTTDAGGLLPR